MRQLTSIRMTALTPILLHTSILKVGFALGLEMTERDIRDGQPFPEEYLEPLRRLWEDPSMQKCWEQGNEAALPDNLSYFFGDLDRLFDQFYVPIEQDIVHTRTRTIGITETVFNLRENEMLIVDVVGQKSERRKWIHCFQDVTSILFLILFLNKDDLFQKKYHSLTLRTSSLYVAVDFDGEANDVCASCDYFRKHFARLAQKVNQKEREIYIHITTATDTAMLRVIMAAIEEEATAMDAKRLPRRKRKA
ncbi:G-protein alpha subunit-domain-containing protein [Cytidiella melzeri]|nr:G-protein alpha subunit-domain-containing protein [Cytidiella melzeri]